MDRREAIVKRGERRRGFVPYWLRTMAEVDVDFLEAYERIYELTAVRKGKLPPKVREMIVVAAVSIGGYLPGIKDHVRRALRLGATKEELVGFSRVLFPPALIPGARMVALIDVLTTRGRKKASARAANVPCGAGEAARRK